MADARVEALRASVERLRSLTAEMSQADLTRRAYPAEWTIADVLSHLGSGAVITQRRLDDAVAGTDTPDDFAPGVWDTWNAKDPVARRDDALAADADLIARIDAVTPDQRRSFTSPMGPMHLDFEQFIGMRLNEHALHTWDIDVVADPTATIPDDAGALVVDNLDLIARFTARPTGDTTTITITTTNPTRHFSIDLTPDTATFTTTANATATDLQLTAEAFVRLVYGRLDPDHTPTGDPQPALDVLRRVFPGP